MFGRIRASPLSVECLELERLPSKMLKDDSLSIYETTLLKLKQGSQRTVTSPDEMIAEPLIDHNKSSPISDESMSTASEGPVMESLSAVNLFSTQSKGSTYSSYSDSSISTMQETRNMSILYMFSNYKQSSYHMKEKGLQNDEVMDTEDGCLTDCEITDVLS